MLVTSVNHCFLSSLLSSGHPWVRTVTTGTAELLGSTTDWVPPGWSRHVSKFPGPECHCVCVCACVRVCPHQPMCFLSAMHRKWKTLSGHSVVHRLAVLLVSDQFSMHLQQRSLKGINTQFYSSLSLSLIRNLHNCDAGTIPVSFSILSTNSECLNLDDISSNSSYNYYYKCSWF